MSGSKKMETSVNPGVPWISSTPKINGQRFESYLEKTLVGAGVRSITVAKGSTIFTEGDPGDGAYFIGKGKVEIRCSTVSGTNRVLAIVGPGEIFGEMALLDQATRSASAVAIETSLLYVVSAEKSKHLFRQIPQLSFWILNVLANRLRRTDRVISQMVQVHEVNRQILSAQQSERKRIARELHDGPAQAFADYVMRLQIIERCLDKKPEMAVQEIRELQESVKEGLDKIREVICDIHPRELAQEGLAGAIENFADRVCNRSGLRFEFNCGVLPQNMQPSLEAALYCIVQEGVNNIRKHGNASVVKIEIETDTNELVLTISDDGQGFDVKKLLERYSSGGSYGLSSMEDRARLAGGEMNIQSAPGIGTMLYFRMPLTCDGDCEMKV